LNLRRVKKQRKMRKIKIKIKSKEYFPINLKKKEILFKGDF